MIKTKYLAKRKLTRWNITLYTIFWYTWKCCTVAGINNSKDINEYKNFILGKDQAAVVQVTEGSKQSFNVSHLMCVRMSVEDDDF